MSNCLRSSSCLMSNFPKRSVTSTRLVFCMVTGRFGAMAMATLCCTSSSSTSPASATASACSRRATSRHIHNEQQLLAHACTRMHAHTHTTVLQLSLWNLSGTTRMSQYQKKHSPTPTYRGHQPSLICFIHLLQSMASSLFNLHA